MKLPSTVLSTLFAGMAAASLAAPAQAQEAPAPASAPASGAAAAATPAVGATVYDPQGAEVGKIASIANGVAVIDTGANKASVAVESIGTGTKGPAIGYTRAQLDAAVAAASTEAAAALSAALVAGAEVKSQDGVAVGTIKEVNASGQVVINRSSGKPVALPKDTLTMKDGGVALLFTAAQFEEAVGKSAGAAPASQPGK